MGKASKWFRGLLGLKRVAELPSKEKRRWSFVKSYREREKEKDQTTAGGITPPEWAAIKIQAAFRGSLARKALRALKGLVKLQALVRGHIERKRTAEWLQRVQALLRVQAQIRAVRAQIWNAKSSSTAHLHLHGPAPATPDKYDQSSSVLKRNSSKSRIDDEQAHMTTSKRGNLFYSSSQKQKQQAMVSDHINYSPSNSPQASSNLGSPLTPSRSTDGSRSHLSGYSEPEYPSYMAYTESSKAKLRSLSAPKQRYSLHQSKLHTQRIHATFNNKPAYLATARLDNFGLGLPPLPPLPYKY